MSGELGPTAQVRVVNLVDGVTFAVWGADTGFSPVLVSDDLAFASVSDYFDAPLNEFTMDPQIVLLPVGEVPDDVATWQVDNSLGSDRAFVIFTEHERRQLRGTSRLRDRRCRLRRGHDRCGSARGEGGGRRHDAAGRSADVRRSRDCARAFVVRCCSSYSRSTTTSARGVASGSCSGPGTRWFRRPCWGPRPWSCAGCRSSRACRRSDDAFLSAHSGISPSSRAAARLSC